MKPNRWGNQTDGDNSIYNGDLVETIGRLAKPTTPGSGNGALEYGLARFPGDTLGRKRDKFGSYHNGGLVQFVFGDGVVRSLSPATSTVTLGRLANRSDGLTVTLPD